MRLSSPTQAFACLLLAASLTVLPGCRGGNDEAAKKGGDRDRPVPVGIETVRQQPWQDTVQALGTVRARESVDVTAKVSESVQRVHFESGQEVGRGAVLVTLTGQQQLAALRAAEASAAEAEQLYQRQAQLAPQQLIARASLDSQRATRDAARAQVAQVRANLSDRQIRAPFAGVLGIRQVSPGALLTPNAVIATLDDISRMYVDFQVPEATLSAMVPGARVSATTAAWPGKRFEGEVQTADARIDAGTRAVTVRAVFDNPERLLRPGMLLDVSLFRPERQALVVPEIAVVQVGRDSFVYRVAQDGKVEQAAVRVGVRRDGKAEILEGLTAGDRIVVDGTGKLRPGVVVAEAAPAGPEPAAAATAPDGN